jgi:hypothetical protein
MCVCMRVRETATCTAFANLHRRHLQPCVSQLGCLRPQPYGLRSDQINFMLSMRGCIWIPCGNARCEDVSSHASALQALPQPLQVTLVLDTPRLPAAASVAACWFVDLRLADRPALGARRRRRERLRARELARGGQPGRGADRAMASKRISKELQVCPDRPAWGHTLHAAPASSTRDAPSASVPAAAGLDGPAGQARRRT